MATVASIQRTRHASEKDFELLAGTQTMYWMIYLCVCVSFNIIYEIWHNTNNSTAQGGGGSFKDRTL